MLGENSVQELKDYMHQKFEEILQAVNKVELTVAKEYVTKQELKDFKDDQKWLVGKAIVITGILVGLIGKFAF